MTTAGKYLAEGSLNLITSIHNIMQTFYYSNITEFAVNLKGILDEVKYKTTIQNMYKLS